MGGGPRIHLGRSVVVVAAACLLGGLILVIQIAVQARATTGIDWPSYAFDAAQTGYNPSETTLSAANVASLTKLWSVDAGYLVTAQPLVATGVTVGAKTLDLVYVATETGNLLALNAATGAKVWQQRFGSVSGKCDGTLHPWGISGTPALDRASNRIYAVDGKGKAYALNLGTGAIANGWPVTVTTSPQVEHIYSAVNVINGTLYVATSSFCDRGTYFGRIVAINTVTATQSAVWNVVPTTGQGGGAIWGMGGIVYDAGTASIFTATGNALGNNEASPYGEAVAQLSTSLQLLASNHPSSVKPTGDFDFGSTPMLFQASGCPAQLAVPNKDGILFLYNQASIANGPVQQLKISNQPVVGDSAYWPVGQIVYTPVANTITGGPKRGLIAYHVGADCQLTQVWNVSLGGGQTTGATVANGVVYAGTRVGPSSMLFALNAQTGQQLWSFTGHSAMNLPPVVVNGRVYATSWDHHVYAFALP